MKYVRQMLRTFEIQMLRTQFHLSKEDNCYFEIFLKPVTRLKIYIWMYFLLLTHQETFSVKDKLQSVPSRMIPPGHLLKMLQHFSIGLSTENS